MLPLVFQPLLRPRIWGGRRLADLLGKSLPDEQPYGESWELSGLPGCETAVSDGPLRGTTLSELWRQHREELIGARQITVCGDDFPLLIKWLDCTDRVSVQVHPDDKAAAALLNEPCGKAEAWVVIEARPGAAVSAGFKPGMTPARYEEQLLAGDVLNCLHTYSPRGGDAVYVPPGTVHTLGAGLVLLEIEQPSDATFRIEDWNRPGLDGRSRPLHRAEAREAIDWSRGPVAPVVPQPITTAENADGELLVQSPHFRIERFSTRSRFAGPYAGEMTAWTVVAHRGDLRASDGSWSRDVRKGQTLLVPASSPALEWRSAEGGVLQLIAVRLPG